MLQNDAESKRIQTIPNYLLQNKKQDVKLAEELLNSIMKEPWEHEILQVKEQFCYFLTDCRSWTVLGVLRAGPAGRRKDQSN